MNPKVSIIILNRNRKNLTDTCLRSLEKLTYPNYNVIVVDNGSTDGSQDLIKEKFPYITLIENGKNLGFARGMNVGIKHALENEADYVFVVLNNDTAIISRNLLEELVKTANSDKKIGIVGPKVMDYDGPSKVQFNGKIKHLSGFTMEVSGCGFLAKKEVLEDVGLYGPIYFMYYEDLDLFFRVKKKGYRIVFVPSVKIKHKGFGTSNQFGFYHQYYHIRNNFLFLKRYYPKKMLFIVKGVSRNLLRSIRDCLRCYLNRNLKGLLSSMRGTIKGLLDGIILILNTKNFMEGRV